MIQIHSESHSSNFLQTEECRNCSFLCGSFTKILMSKLRTSVHNINIWMKWIMDELRPRCTLGWTLLAVSCEMCECSQVGTSAPQHLCRHTVTLHHTPHYEDHPPRSSTHTVHTHHTASHCFIFVRKCLCSSLGVECLDMGTSCLMKVV